MATFSVATFNLYQFAEPGKYWYKKEYDATNDMDDHWEPKKKFIKNKILEMNVDIIGFQEVFSIKYLKNMLNEMGFEYFSTVENAMQTDTDDDVYKSPVVAIASRYEIKSLQPVAPRPQVESTGLLADKVTFQRGVIEAEIAVPGLRKPLIVYVVHLKSQSARVDEDKTKAFPDWESRFQYHTETRVKAQANQILQRTAEALMLRDHVLKRATKNPDQGFILLGDFNEAPGGIMERIMTQNEPIRHIAGVSTKKLSDQDRAHAYKFQLYDSRKLVVSQTGVFPPTHAANGSHPASTLDYVFVSNSLNPENKNCVAKVIKVRVLNDHHEVIDDDRRDNSDHAPVLTVFEIGEDHATG